jgi:hypothetical protein
MSDGKGVIEEGPADDLPIGSVIAADTDAWVRRQPAWHGNEYVWHGTDGSVHESSSMDEMLADGGSVLRRGVDGA